MSIRILIPVLERNGMESRVSPHFGRAPYLAVLDADDDGRNVKITFVNGEGPHDEGHGEDEEKRARGVHGSIIDLHPDVIIASMMGPRAVMDFRANNIKLVSADGKTVSDLVSAYLSGKYKDLMARHE